VSRLLVAQRALTVPGWAKDALWRRAQAIPSLDLRFADSKSLVDATTGSNLVTFTRASSGTYVGSDGVLRTATTNLLLRSEEFGDASWTKGNASITANSIAAPNGTLTGAKIVEDTSSATHYARRSTSPTINTNPITFSVYVKAAERIYVGLAIQEATTFTRQSNVNFNLGSGTANTVGNIGGAGSASATIIPVGNGWYRCTLTTTLGGTDTNALSWIYVSTSSGFNYTGDGTSGVYLWGAQLEQSATVGEYIPTTSTINSAPRFDHNPTTGESLGLLVEEQRTNLLVRSEEFDTTWTPTRASVTANTTLAPNGTATADSLIEDSTASASHFLSQTVTFAAGSYTFFCYLKANTRSAVRLICFDNTTTFAVYFDMSTGTVGSTTGGATGSISLMADGWYRCSITFTAAAGTGYARVGLAVAGSQSYTGDGTSGIYIWGAQLEAGAFPTSYIPTTTAAVTRSADVASITGSAFSSWYRQDEGTFFVDAAEPLAYVAFQAYLSLQGASNIDEIRIWRIGATTISSSHILNSASQGSINTTVNAIANRFAHSYSVAQGLASSVNGDSVTTSALTSTIPVTLLRIGARSNNTFYGNRTYKRICFWPQALPGQLQTLTQ
jgi:hypothetical protein